MTIAALTAEQARLVLPRFNEHDVLTLDNMLATLAETENLPVVINIRTANRTLFQASMPGTAPVLEAWVRRKSNVALMFQKSSLQVGTELREKGSTLANDGLSAADYADHGGAVPIVVGGVGVVAVATVSGLPRREDHALAVRGIEALLKTLPG